MKWELILVVLEQICSINVCIAIQRVAARIVRDPLREHVGFTQNNLGAKKPSMITNCLTTSLFCQLVANKPNSH